MGDIMISCAEKNGDRYGDMRTMSIRSESNQ